MEKYKCVDPTVRLHCNWCGNEFYCGDAPHDIEGPLCPCCDRGEDLVEIEENNHA